MSRSFVIGVAIVGVVVLAGAALILSGRSGGPLGGAAGPQADPEGGQGTAAKAGPAAIPSFDVVRIEPDGSAVIAGRAPAGARITLLDGDKPVATAQADARGEWVMVPDAPLQPGARDLRVEATTPDGTTVKGTETVTLVVPAPRKDIAGRAKPQTGGALALLTPDAGPARILQSPATGGAGGPYIDGIDYDAQGRFGVVGRAGPGTEVQVYLDTTLIGRTRADSAGRWQMAPDRALEPGRYVLRIDQVGADGKVAARAEVQFERRVLDDDLLGGRAVVVLPGNNLWAIARRSYGSGPRYAMIFDANQDQIRDPNLIYPGQIFILPAGGTAPAGQR